MRDLPCPCAVMLHNRGLGRPKSLAAIGSSCKNNQQKGLPMAKSILIIDDDPVVVKYLQTLFEESDYETDSASNGVEGMEKLKARKPDLVTLDLEMPEEWGSRLYRKMSKDKELKDIPIIVISGMSGRHAVKSAVAYVAKPFDPDKLLALVKSILQAT